MRNCVRMHVRVRMRVRGRVRVCMRVRVHVRGYIYTHTEETWLRVMVTMRGDRCV